MVGTGARTSATQRQPGPTHALLARVRRAQQRGRARGDDELRAPRLDPAAARASPRDNFGPFTLKDAAVLARHLRGSLDWLTGRTPIPAGRPRS